MDTQTHTTKDTHRISLDMLEVIKNKNKMYKDYRQYIHNEIKTLKLKTLLINHMACNKNTDIDIYCVLL